jgi:hypothetical protein
MEMSMEMPPLALVVNLDHDFQGQPNDLAQNYSAAVSSSAGPQYWDKNTFSRASSTGQT